MGASGRVWVVVGVLAWAWAWVDAHGRLMEPVSRSSAWRKGFDTPVNWEDDELNCGGFGTQYDQNDGQCGVCGDNWADPRPRDNEAGGIYGTGTIVAEYTMGQVVEVEVELSTSHLGFFEFRLCVNNAPDKYIEQECLDQHLLQLADGSGTLFPIPYLNDAVNLTIPVILPEDLTCTQCVFQWHYNCGNNWGDCGNGTEAMGCGPQEWFRGCADVSVS